MDIYIGQIILFAGQFAPEGTLPCDGRLLAVSQYQALFSLIGAMYGGDGTKTFALPNLCGRVPLGAGPSQEANGLSTSPHAQQGGQEVAQLTNVQLPAHAHAYTFSLKDANLEGKGKIETLTAEGTITSYATPGSAQIPEGYLANARVNGGVANNAVVQAYVPATAAGVVPANAKTIKGVKVEATDIEVDMKLSGVAATSQGTTSSAGLGQAFSIMQPYLAMQYAIAYAGDYPVRPE